MAETVLNQEEQKVVSKKSPNKKDLYKKATIILSILMIGLTIYVKIQENALNSLSQVNDSYVNTTNTLSKNYQSYVKQYKETKVQLDETTKKLEVVSAQLNDVTSQLETTKTLLAQTQDMLTQAQTENAKLREDIQSIDGGEKIQNIGELEARISTLKSKNQQTNNELADLKVQLKAFQADFSTLVEGRSLITLFQNKIKVVKSRMRYLEQEAYFAKIAAQKEKDRIAILNGNNGYFVKDGAPKKPGVGSKNYSIDVKILQ